MKLLLLWSNFIDKETEAPLPQMVKLWSAHMVCFSNLHFQNCCLANSVIFQKEIQELLMLFDFFDNYKMNCKLKI